MEKYGVEVEEEKVKQAHQVQHGTCPDCGQLLDEGGACPTHGTEPFEKRPDPKKE